MAVKPLPLFPCFRPKTLPTPDVVVVVLPARYLIIFFFRRFPVMLLFFSFGGGGLLLLFEAPRLDGMAALKPGAIRGFIFC